MLAGNFGKGEVAGHDRRDSLPDQEPVGDQFALPELVEIGADPRQHQVGIAVRGAVAGEVLGGGHDAGTLQAAKEGHRQQPGLHRIGTERARADHRGRGIGVHVHGGREVHVDAERGQLGAEVAPGVVRVRGQAGCAQGEVAGSLRRGVLDVADPAPLLVGGDEQRNLPRLAPRRLLQRRGGGGELIQTCRVAGKELDAAEAALLDPAPQLRRHRGARVAEHEHLSQQLVVAHGAGQGAHRRGIGDRLPERYLRRGARRGALLRRRRQGAGRGGGGQQQRRGERAARHREQVHSGAA